MDILDDVKQNQTEQTFKKIVLSRQFDAAKHRFRKTSTDFSGL